MWEWGATYRIWSGIQFRGSTNWHLGTRIFLALNTWQIIFNKTKILSREICKNIHTHQSCQTKLQLRTHLILASWWSLNIFSISFPRIASERLAKALINSSQWSSNIPKRIIWETRENTNYCLLVSLHRNTHIYTGYKILRRKPLFIIRSVFKM